MLLLPPAVPMPQLYRRTGGGAGRSNGREEGGSWEVVEGRGVVTAEGGREQQEAVWFGLAHEALPAPRPRRKDLVHGPQPCGEAAEPDIGYGHGAARSWRGLQVGANRPARARQPRRCQ